MYKFVFAVLILASPYYAFAEEEADPVDELAKSLNLTVQEVWEGSDEITEAEEAELAKVGDEITTRGIRGFVIVYHTKKHLVYMSRGRLGKNLLGVVPPYAPVPLYVGDWKGDTKLWASSAWSGTPKGSKWTRTVKGSHYTYRWNL